MMEPALDNGGRWYRHASEHDVKRAMSDKQADIIECPIIGLTFVVSRAHSVILRCAALGGDTRNIEGGWVYPNDIALQLDAHELRNVARIKA